MVKKNKQRTVPNFVEIAQTTAEICQFSIFQDGGLRHLGFLKFQIFNGLNGHCVKFRQNRWNMEPRLRYGYFSIILQEFSRIFQDSV